MEYQSKGSVQSLFFLPVAEAIDPSSEGEGETDRKLSCCSEYHAHNVMVEGHEAVVIDAQVIVNDPSIATVIPEVTEETIQVARECRGDDESNFESTLRDGFQDGRSQVSLLSRHHHLDHEDTNGWYGGDQLADRIDISTVFPLPSRATSMQQDHISFTENIGEEQDVPVAYVPVSFIEESVNRGGEENPMQSASSYLYDMIRQNRTCSINEGLERSASGCKDIVQHCQQRPQQARYVSENGRTPLHEACLRKCCCHIVEALIWAYPKAISEKDCGGNIPLHRVFDEFHSHLTSSHCIEPIVGILLSTKSDVAAENEDMNTPLHLACAASETRTSNTIVSMLVQASTTSVIRPNIKMQTPLHLYCERQNAKVNVTKTLIEIYPEASEILDSNGWAPIHYAAANANAILLEFLVETFPEMATARTSNLETPLHILCRFCSKLSSSSSSKNQNDLYANILTSATVLIRADPNATTKKSSTRLFTPLHLLCRGGSFSTMSALVEVLLNSASLAAFEADSDDYLPLHHACETRCDDRTVTTLLQHNPGATFARTRKGDSALSLACAIDERERLIGMLIESNPNALTMQNKYGYAPIHCVCRANEPRLEIVQRILKACPTSVLLKTNAGESPLHLISCNQEASVGILHVLTRVRNHVLGNKNVYSGRFLPAASSFADSAIDTVGNTPLHDACFRGRSFEQIKALLLSHPEWVWVCNKAGLTALQILCKRGKMDIPHISLFTGTAGKDILRTVDAGKNTLLHSAIRADTKVETLRNLIESYPGALNCRTLYGDTPLHHACLRKVDIEVILALTLAPTCGDPLLLLERNLEGESPIAIAGKEFCDSLRNFSGCCVTDDFTEGQERAYQVLAVLVKILYYGPIKCRSCDMESLSLLHASLSLYHRGVHLDAIFLKRVLYLHPEDAFFIDEFGNSACHIEASVPEESIDRMDGETRCCRQRCNKNCHKRAGVLSLLLDVNPGATHHRNQLQQFPLGLMINCGRSWGQSCPLTVALQANPAAAHWVREISDHLLPFVLRRVSIDCGPDTLFALIRSRPGLADSTNQW